MYMYYKPTFLSPQPRPHTKATPPTTYFFDAPPPGKKKHGQQRVVVLQKVQHLQFNGAPRFVFQFRPPDPNEIVPQRGNVRHIGGSVRGGVPDFDSNRLICVRAPQKTFQTENQKRPTSFTCTQRQRFLVQ